MSEYARLGVVKDAGGRSFDVIPWFEPENISK